MNVVFLDFDGVVNTPMWSFIDGAYKCRFNFPDDGKVNNWQAVQWVSAFCQDYNYSIVISSTWRLDGERIAKNCLVMGGLRSGIRILGATPHLLGKQRGEEITMWLSEHPEVKGYLIFDDDSDMTCHMDRLVQSNVSSGFTRDEYARAVMLHQAFNQ
jgi:hypothetical protein